VGGTGTFGNNGWGQQTVKRAGVRGRQGWKGKPGEREMSKANREYASLWGCVKNTLHMVQDKGAYEGNWVGLAVVRALSGHGRVLGFLSRNLVLRAGLSQTRKVVVNRHLGKKTILPPLIFIVEVSDSFCRERTLSSGN